jgi:hypothetical protein
MQMTPNETALTDEEYREMLKNLDDQHTPLPEIYANSKPQIPIFGEAHTHFIKLRQGAIQIDDIPYFFELNTPIGDFLCMNYFPYIYIRKLLSGGVATNF